MPDDKPRQKPPIAAADVPGQRGSTGYPPPWRLLVQGRTKRKIGDWFNLTRFGVNLTTLEPGAASSVMHCHATQDELVYVLSGQPTLVMDDTSQVLGPGDCIGFPAGTGVAHQFVNDSDEPAVILEIGDRDPSDRVDYPHDDLRAEFRDGSWVFLNRDGQPFE
ncbi:MAG: cupin domain-containing protein [Candidatus Dadabacteria bacterium]|nr:MAG: cupin domain-containing protein [Candidatus Dadabacteria bacterium]